MSDKLDLIGASGKKPILKHRTISELLSLPRPSSPILEASDLTDGDDLQFDEDGQIRPPLLHTKSDTNIIRRSNNRRISPPRVVVGMDALSNSQSNSIPTIEVNTLESTGSRGSDSSNSPRGGSSDLESNSGSNRRHIHFNTFVEQCISIDKPRNSTAVDDESEEDDEADDDILEIRSLSGSSTTSVFSQHSRPAFTRRDSSEKDLISIAPIAPTILKSSELHPAPSPAVVFVPPTGSLYEGEHHVLQYHATQQKSPGYAPPVPASVTDYTSSSSASSSASSQSQWEDEEEDYGVGFDYFNGPDLGVGQEYDTPSDARASSYSPRGQRNRTPSSVPTDVSTTPTQSDSHLVNSVAAAFASRHEQDNEDAHTHSSNSSNQSDSTVQPPAVSGPRSPVLPNGRTRVSLPSAPSQSPPARSPPRPGRSILKNADAGNATPVAYRASYGSPPDSSYLSPSDLRGRSLSPGGEERGRSNVRTPPAIEERERSTSRGTSSPIGSVSPNSSRPGSALGRRRAERGGAVSGEEVTRTVPIGVVANAIVSSSGVSLNSRKPKFAQGTARPSLVINHSPVSAKEGAETTSGSVEEGISGAELERRRDDFWADSTEFIPPPPVAHVLSKEKPRKAADDKAHVEDEIDGDGMQYSFDKGANAATNKTPANSPVTLRSRPLPSEGDMASRLPHVSTPLPPGPTQAYATAALGAQGRDKEKIGERDEDGTLVGRAVDMVHSARGILGAIWNGRGPVPAE